MQTAMKIRDTKHLVPGPNSLSASQRMHQYMLNTKKQQLPPPVTNALADPPLVWTDANLAILQSASLILPCPASKFFVGYQTRSLCGIS